VSDDFKTVIVARFHAIPTDQVVEVFKWPRWIAGLQMKPHVQHVNEWEIPPVVTRLRDGISLLKLPDHIAAEGLRCVDAFRYWQHTDPMSQPTLRFTFVKTAADPNRDYEKFFVSFCKHRLFMKGKIYDHGDGDHMALMLDAPYAPFGTSIVKAPRFYWWMTIENGRFIPKKKH